jgi:outer membrane protein TolC
LESAVTEAYLNHLRAIESIGVLGAYRRAIDDLYQVAAMMRQFSNDQRMDDIRWEDELARAMAAEHSARFDVYTTRVELNLLLNQPGPTEFSMATAQLDEKQRAEEFFGLTHIAGTSSAQAATEDYLVRQALSASPLLRRLDADIEMVETGLSYNKARFYPEIGFRASLDAIDNLRNTPEFEEKSTQWWVGARLQWPLYLGGERFKERDRLRADLSRTQNEKDAAILEVVRRVRLAASETFRHAHQLPFVARSRELAEVHTKEVIGVYSKGNLSYVEALEAVRNRRDAMLSTIDNRIDYWIAVSRLLTEIGWSAHENQRTPGDDLLTRLATGQPVERDGN